MTTMPQHRLEQCAACPAAKHIPACSPDRSCSTAALTSQRGNRTAAPLEASCCLRCRTALPPAAVLQVAHCPFSNPSAQQRRLKRCAACPVAHRPQLLPSAGPVCYCPPFPATLATAAQHGLERYCAACPAAQHPGLIETCRSDTQPCDHGPASQPRYKRCCAVLCCVHKRPSGLRGQQSRCRIACQAAEPQHSSPWAA
jgi:hypothetical protein